MANKVYHLTINNHPFNLVLAPASSRGYCFKCQLQKAIRLISEKPFGLSWEIRKFCSSCALINLDELEEYNFENKTQVIKKLRQALENYG